MRKARHRRPEAAVAWPHRGGVLLGAVLSVAAAVGVAQFELRRPATSQTDTDAQRLVALFPGGPERWDAVMDATQGPPEVPAMFAELGDRAGAAGVRALRLLGESGESSLTLTFGPHRDAVAYPIAWVLREHATPEVDAALLGMAADRDLQTGTRISAIVALCRPENADDVGRLTDVAADINENSTVREQLLLRLPRIDAAPPARLRELVLLPFGGLDVTAAVTLGAMGDAFAPSLWLDVLRRDVAEYAKSRGGCYGTGDPDLVLRAVQRLASDDIRVRDAVERAITANQQRRHEVNDWRLWSTTSENATPTGSQIRELDQYDETTEVVDAFTTWLAVHPEALTTGLAEMRQEYLASPQREREERSMDAERVLDLSDDDIDVAAAVITLRRGAEAAEQDLWDLHRIVTWLHPYVDAAPTPLAKLEVLQRALIPDHLNFKLGRDPNELRAALRDRFGICMTWTTLFVAIGDRLDLPLHAVSLPNHVFVRWDDGQTRFNFDPTNGGAVTTDAEYAEAHGTTLDDPYELRNLSPRQLIGNNLANSALFTGFHLRFVESRLVTRHLELARLATHFDPLFEGAWRNRARIAKALGREYADDATTSARALRRLPGYRAADE